MEEITNDPISANRLSSGDAKDVRITMEMIRAGVDEYRRSDLNTEEIELIVAKIYYAMALARPRSV